MAPWEYGFYYGSCCYKAISGVLYQYLRWILFCWVE